MSSFDETKKMIGNEGQEALAQGAKEIKKSSQDWWCYVETHPIQSMIFGVIGYFALKGLMKN